MNVCRAFMLLNMCQSHMMNVELQINVVSIKINKLMVIHSIQGNNQMTMNLMVGTSLKKDKRRNKLVMKLGLFH